MKTAEKQLHPTIAAAVPAMIDLCKKYGVKKLEIFGSAVRDDFDSEHSDLDIIIDLGEPDDTYAERYLGFCEEIEALAGRKVDVLSSRYRRNPYFWAHVDQDRRSVYEAA